MSLGTCPSCGKPLLWDGSESRTLVGYFSPPGHDHDDNCRKRAYSCANGHYVVESIRRRCPVPGCGWVGAPDCFCNTGPHESRGGTTVCYLECQAAPLPHHHIAGEIHPGTFCDSCREAENRIPKVDEWSVA
jgi:hypothetical protein